MKIQKHGYYIDDERVPSVTTILGRFKESGGLIHWAWKLGTEGKDYRVERDLAADAGTMAHKAVESFIKNWPFKFEGDPEVCKRAAMAFQAFQSWAEQTQLRITKSELPLVSKMHRYGGTFDAILVQNQRAMGDWKSSNAIYPEYLIQIAAYGRLWEENFPEEPITGGYHLIRFDKTHGDFSHFWWANLDEAWEAFLLLRRLYEIDKQLRKRAK